MDEGLLAFFTELGDVLLELDARNIVIRCYGPPQRLGAPSHSLCGKHIDKALPMEAAYPLKEAIERLRRSGERQTIEFLWPCKTFRYFEAQLAAAPGGRVIALLRDIHDRKSAQLELACNREQLFESEIRFRSMADHAPVLLWMTGTDGLCSFFNQRWMEFTGREMQNEIGVGWAEGVHPEDFQSCMLTYMESFVARRDFIMEYRLRRADGEYRWIYDQGTPRIAPDGTFLGYIGSCIDVTDIRNARETLKRVNEDLERSVQERTMALQLAIRELEAFSYSVSHDLRGPLRIIDGFSAMLLSDYGRGIDARGQHLLDEVRNSAQRMGLLIDDLLRLSRVSRSEPQRRAVSVSEVARSVVHDLKLRDPHHRVTIDIQEDLVAYADDRLLRILLDNLLGNAWKFTAKRENPSIALGAQRHNGGIVYFVRDNGAGFNMVYAPKLFRPFQRLHDANEFQGTGIGLATAQRIVDRHAGRIWAEAEENVGATFYFTLSAP